MVSYFDLIAINFHSVFLLHILINKFVKRIVDGKFCNKYGL